MCPTDGSLDCSPFLLQPLLLLTVQSLKEKNLKLIIFAVLGSEEAAKDAIIYSYKAAASGFSAKLTPEQVSQISIYMLQEQDVYAAEMERTFIAIKPDGVQRGLIAEIMSRFEHKGFKLVAVKLVVPNKEFAEKHYHDLKERPFFSGLCDFLSSGPVLAMVWEGEGVIKYGRKLIGATDPQKSEPGTIRGDLAVVVGRFGDRHCSTWRSSHDFKMAEE